MPEGTPHSSAATAVGWSPENAAKTAKDAGRPKLMPRLAGFVRLAVQRTVSNILREIKVRHGPSFTDRLKSHRSANVFVNKQDEDGNTALHLAVKKNDFSMVRLSSGLLGLAVSDVTPGGPTGILPAVALEGVALLDMRDVSVLSLECSRCPVEEST
ncbi:hypothetical protein FOZ61_002100 [Perkinsus olseni]|uniref:Uncharacterized protein n=1 Tax=Perkinsus olseni TaxID=32597 RepID=A0A7J6LUK5_PEROL|nr:hypothetical protein FOZ61_002100 [Perkinsus olseni]